MLWTCTKDAKERERILEPVPSKQAQAAYIVMLLSSQQSPSAREVAERSSCQEWKQNKGYPRGTGEEEIRIKMNEKAQDRLSSINRRILKGKLY